MSLEKIFYELLAQTVLEVPKARYSREELLETVGTTCGETSDSWLVPCEQSAHSPATEDQISETEKKLGLQLPADFRRFLMLSNGGKFYQAPLVWLQDTFPGAQHVRYHVFGTSELVDINRSLFQQFRQILGDDPDFRDCHRLNYVAFCDAHNGNYLALLKAGQEAGRIFFLDREYFGRPYSELEADFYYTVAESLECWLELVVKTKGWNGFGEVVPGF